MEALKVERDSLEMERDDLATRLWEQEKILEGKRLFSGLGLSFYINIVCSGSKVEMHILVSVIM